MPRIAVRDASAPVGLPFGFFVPDRPLPQKPDASGAAFRVPAPGEIVASKYHIEAVLGAGGMGVVLLAENLAIGQKVAIKFISAADEQRREEATARLVREARAVAGLRGEHVVRVYDVGESEEGAPFIVMELLEGLDLGEIVAKVPRLPIADAVGLLIQACRGVEEAHHAGIVHRDLKPSNLFIVRRQNGKACLKVLDFGISKSISSEGAELKTLTGSRVILGSPHYMSPEQVRDARKVDHRTDIWSLGVILYQLLTGKPAFTADTYPGIYAAIAADTPPSPRALRPEIPAQLEHVLFSCLSRDAGARFQQVEELRRALEPFCPKEPDFDDLLASQPGAAPFLAAASQSGPRRTASTSQGSALAPVVLEDATRTQVSQGTCQPDWEDRSLADRTQRSPSELPPKVSPTRRLIVLSVAALGVLGLVLFSKGSDPPEERVGPLPLTLSFESRPSGARVREGEKFYGTTPVEIQVSAAKGRLRRNFALELSGYRPYLLEHRPEQGSIRIRADLIPEPAPRPAEPISKLTPALTRKPAFKVPPPRPSASAVPEPEIRLQR